MFKRSMWVLTHLVGAFKNDLDNGRLGMIIIFIMNVKMIRNGIEHLELGLICGRWDGWIRRMG